VPRDAQVPILQGPLRGKRWIVGAGVHGYWLGSYEWDKCRAFAAAVRPGAVVFDVGANVGYYTLLAAELVRPSGQVFAFEPLPRNAYYLRAHLEMNRATTVRVTQAAVADCTGDLFFQEAQEATMGHVSDRGSLRVPAVTLDELVQSQRAPLPDVIKMDIEGGELRALQGAVGTLTRGQPVVFLATHGPAVHRECCDLLTGLGYRVRPLAGAGALDATDEVVACKP